MFLVDYYIYKDVLFAFLDVKSRFEPRSIADVLKNMSMLIRITKIQFINNCIPRENFKFSELFYQDQFKKVERDHCIAKLLGFKDITLLHTQWNKMVFPIFPVFQLNVHMISGPNVSFQNHIQIGKFMKWNYMTRSWNYKVHVGHFTLETLQ